MNALEIFGSLCHSLWHKQIKRVTYSFDSSNLKTIVSDVRSDSLAIDWISGNLYWINYQVK